MAAPTTSSRAEYLKKYLSDTKEEKKKKKRRKIVVAPAKISKSRIVDDDVDFKSLLPENLSNTLEDDVGDNDPIVADVIDERPEHVKLLEKYRSSGAWKVMGKDPGADSQTNSDSDASLPRKQRHDSSSDESPVRKRRHDSDSDQAPVRRRRHDSDSDQSLVRKTNKQQSGNGQSHARRLRHDSDSDHSPPRKGRKDSGSDQSPPRRRRKDIAVTKSHTRKINNDRDASPPRRNRHASDSDQSPSRKKSHKHSSNVRKRRNSDISPKRNNVGNSDRRTKRRHESDSDPSPPRKSDTHSQSSSKQNNDISDKTKKTLSGKKAGLSSAKDMRREADALRKKEDAHFKMIDDERLGKGAATVFRDKKSGRIRDLDEERRLQSEETKKKEKEDEKYQSWGKGLKQIEDQSRLMADALHEADKPLARYKDDDDLDQMLRDMDRAEDPMLAFIKKKKKKTSGPPVKEKPRYKGPAPPPNRFGIMPGYRWDGVDRSNGFERIFFAKQAEKKAVSQQAYKWSIEDM